MIHKPPADASPCNGLQTSLEPKDKVMTEDPKSTDEVSGMTNPENPNQPQRRTLDKRMISQLEIIRSQAIHANCLAKGIEIKQELHDIAQRVNALITDLLINSTEYREFIEAEARKSGGD